MLVDDFSGKQVGGGWGRSEDEKPFSCSNTDTVPPTLVRQEQEFQHQANKQCGEDD